MEEQEILSKEIGTKEPEKKKLEPAKVKIVKVRVENIEKAKSFKAIFECKHPGSETPISLSAVSFLDGKIVKTVGTWINVDEDNKLQKGTGTTKLMERIGATTLNGCIDKEADTEIDYSGYLVFKAY
jgi:hypothetical protein